ncbi:hypothetical protein [Fusibacter bizertensis]
MKRLQGFILGLMATIIIFAAFPTFADTVSVVFNTINLKINGVEVAKAGDQFTLDNGDKVPFSIIYKGTTYLPLKKIGQLLDKSIVWEGTTKTISVNDNGSQSSNQAPISDSNSRFNPANKNEAVLGIDAQYNGDQFDLKVELTDLLRGQSAWEMVEAANVFNEKPVDTQEIILAKFKIDVTNSNNANLQFNLISFNFDLVSSSGKDYEDALFVIPDPTIDAKLYAGASHEGWVGFIVDKTDTKPLIVFKKEYDGSGGMWFKAY